MKLKSWILMGSLLIGHSAYGACLYTNTVDVPPTQINSNNSRVAYLWMSNNSSSVLAINLKVYDQSGNDVTAAVQSSAGVGTILAKGTGGLAIRGNGVTRTIRGELTWTSNSCVTKPMKATLETQWNGSMALQGVGGDGF